MGRRCRAFTLVELLVVVAIVAALAALLFPVFAQARQAAQVGSCLSNGKHLGAAMMLYAGDHDDRFPDTEGASPGGAWVHATYPYLKSHGVYRCPADGTRVVDDAWWGPKPSYVVSYGLNSNLPGVHFQTPGGRLVQRDTPEHSGLASPANTVMLFEVEDATMNPEATNTYATLPGQDPSRWRPDMPPLFIDGPSGNTASDPVRHAIPGGEEEQDWANGQNASGSDRMVRYATGPVGGRVLNVGKGSQPRHFRGAVYVACDGHALSSRPERVSGGADAVDALCDQGTVASQLGVCARQRAVSAAGTGNGRYALTFSAR